MAGKQLPNLVQFREMTRVNRVNRRALALPVLIEQKNAQMAKIAKWRKSGKPLDDAVKTLMFDYQYTHGQINIIESELNDGHS